jgi:hypothetical protein
VLTIDRWKPFYAPEVFNHRAVVEWAPEVFDSVRELVGREAMDRQMLDREIDKDYWSRMQKNGNAVLATMDAACEAIRERVTTKLSWSACRVRGDMAPRWPDSRKTSPWPLGETSAPRAVRVYVDHDGGQWRIHDAYYRAAPGTGSRLVRVPVCDSRATRRFSVRGDGVSRVHAFLADDHSLDDATVIHQLRGATSAGRN